MLAVTRNMRGDARVSTVTDLAYDSFGKRLASVSSDATIRIRDLDDRGEWKVEDRCEIRGAHKVKWACLSLQDTELTRRALLVFVTKMSIVLTLNGGPKALLTRLTTHHSWRGLANSCQWCKD